MLLRHSTLSLFLLIFMTITHLAAGVQIDSVGLDSGLPYVRRWSAAHIKFNLTMETEETLQSVVWQTEDGRGRYAWEPNGSVNVSGILVGAIDISAANGELLFPSAQPDHDGNYSLTVFTSNGSDTATYKLIVHYYSSFVFSYLDAMPICIWSVKMKVYQAAPYPNISCVFEDGIGGGPPIVPLDEIAEVKWNITDHNNGTFNYEMASIIPIQKIPMESSLSYQFWIEGSSISLLKFQSSTIAQPCPEPDTKINLTYTIFNGLESCYGGGYILYTKVNYSCTDEPKSEPHKTLECSRGGRWIETDTTPWPTCSTHVETTTVCENCDSGSALIFHPKLFAATFLIASYYAMK